MQFQDNTSCCSAAAMQNCLRVLGLRIKQSKLAALIGVTDDGADENDILEALEKLGCHVEVFETNKRYEARAWLNERAFVAPLLLCVDDWNHWVSVAGGCKDSLFLFDPDPDTWNKAENGSWPLTDKTILRRWKAARNRKREGSLYYGIAIFSYDPTKAKACSRAGS